MCIPSTIKQLLPAPLALAYGSKCSLLYNTVGVFAAMLDSPTVARTCTFYLYYIVTNNSTVTNIEVVAALCHAVHIISSHLISEDMWFYMALKCPVQCSGEARETAVQSRTPGLPLATATPSTPLFSVLWCPSAISSGPEGRECDWLTPLRRC